MKNFKNSLNSINRNIKGDGFQFLSSIQLPKQNYVFNVLKKLSDNSWITTTETDNLARNHCAAVAATNLSLYLGNLYDDKSLFYSKMILFEVLHSQIGNGPIFTIDKIIKRFFFKKGLFLKSSSISNFEQYKSEIDKGHIVTFLLARGVVNWHWVLGVGYREYDNGRCYAQIITGWNNTSDRYFEIKGTRPWISAKSYFI